MPFVLRTVQPVFVSRGGLADAEGRPKVRDGELEAVHNATLCNAMRQLASLLELADDVFSGLGAEMRGLGQRASGLQQRIQRLQREVDRQDPRTVPVPEGDLSTLAAMPRESHFHPDRAATLARRLFLPETRPAALRRLYEAAARPALGTEALAQLDKLRRDGHKSSTLFLCTPVLGRARRLRSKVVDIDIETRKPASLVEMRKWTSTEALGDVTVHPDCSARIASDGLGLGLEDVDGVDISGDASLHGQQRPGDTTRTRADEAEHQLPTTEEQAKAIAHRFPAEVVRMDVTGRSFTRLSRCRRSLLHPGESGQGVGEEVRRRGRGARRHRSRRRNTIAGTDQKEIEEALNGERPGNTNTLSTMDDIILSSSCMINGNPQSTKETPADFKKWAFNSLKRWGRSRLRAISSINSSTSSNMVSGELHTADPVDDINVYETVAGKRRGAGSIPISAGMSGPMSLAVKMRESSLGHRRLKISDEPPHSSSGNWSASSESGRASVNSDSSHQPKSSTCSSVLPHRRRFINHSTSSSVTSEGTLTPEDMAAVSFPDDGETSSAYSCDTEGYYTSFHMDSGLKTLKEEEAGLSMPATPMHSTSALSNCSSGRGSANLAQLTAESEYELFGKGSTSTTASSAGTVCTTLRADNSRGSDRSLCKGPAVPERKSSLNAPAACKAQECPPCSTVVALIHNNSQAHSPLPIPGDSPDSGHNTSSSPVESVSGPQDTETDALISPIPSIYSEMEFSECSDFEGVDRSERIRVKTTINTSRIPSMCAITPPQSDDEMNTKQQTTATDHKTAERPPAALPNHMRNDNHRFNAIVGHEVNDNDSNNLAFDKNCNARASSPVTKASATNVIHVDHKSGYATIHTLDNSYEHNNNPKVRPPSPSGGTLFINPSTQEEEPTILRVHHQPLIKDALIPFSSMLSKFRKSSYGGRKTPTTIVAVGSEKKEDNESSVDDSGEYVTITDVRNNNKPSSQPTPQHSGATEAACESMSENAWEHLEYVSLNELPVLNPSDVQSPAILSESLTVAESSLERRKKQGARVTLDSEGKVVYSSDSLRRRKGAHTTFAPGQYVKDTSSSPSPSPVANHRLPKSIIRPVQSQTGGPKPGSCGESPSKLTNHPFAKEEGNVSNAVATPFSSKYPVESNSQLNLRPSRTTSPVKPTSNGGQKTTFQPSDLINHRNRVIIRAGVTSPSKDIAKNSNGLQGVGSPRTNGMARGAYVHILPNDKPSVKSNQMYLQTDFDGPGGPKSCISGHQQHKPDPEGPQDVPQPLARFSSDRTASIQNQPVYQNALILGKEEMQVGHSHNNLKQTTPDTPFPNQNHSIDAPLHSSTPTKCDSPLSSLLPVGNAFSPIEKHSVTVELASTGTGGTDNICGERKEQLVQAKTPSLILAPKSTMTAEELYAKIHKSRKQMNIKYEPEIILSPSPSVGAPSPASSERSASPTGVRDPKKIARSRHSWSPNSSKYVDIAGNYDPRSSTPSPKASATKDLGLSQVTSTYDFKCLLLQHGAVSRVKTKLSAVERLKQAKQAATNVLTSNAPKFRFGLAGSKRGPLHSGPSSSELSKPLVSRTSIPKLSQAQTSKLVVNKNDVRSLPILEDQHEDEYSAGFPIQTLLSSPMAGRNFSRNLKSNQPHERKMEDIVPCSALSGRDVSHDQEATCSYSGVKSIGSAKPSVPFPKHLRLGHRQVLPTTLEETDSGQFQSDARAALETAL